MRRTLWIIPLLALLAPAGAHALEVLVLTTTTQVSSYGQEAEIANQGPGSIWCQRGATAAAASVGLAIGNGREIPRGGSLRTGTAQSLFCIAAASQVSGAATVVTAGVVASAGTDPTCATTAADLDPYIGTSITKIDPLVKAKDFTIWPDACTYDCYAAWDPIVPSTVAPLKGFPIEAGSRVPISVGRGSALGPVRIACKGVGCHFHIMRGY